MANFTQIIEHLKFVIKKPKVFLKILPGFFKRNILGKRVLRTIDWAVTYKCNFNCKSCSAKLLMKNSGNKKELTPEQIKNIWNQAIKLGVIHVNLTGGEPLLLSIKVLCQIIKNFQPNKFLVSLVTNGSLASEQKIKKLKEAGLDTLQLSIDSSYPDIHNYIRKSKTNYQQIIDCLKWAKKNKLNVCISTILTRHNFEDIKRLSKFAKENKVFLLINPVSHSGALQNKIDLKLKEEDLGRYYKLLQPSHVRADTILNFSGRGGCPGGTERIYITPYGEVMTCPHVQIFYGNVLRESLKVIHTRMANFLPIKKFSKYCKHTFDKKYIADLLVPIRCINKLPISIFDHPIIKQDKNLMDSLKS